MSKKLVILLVCIFGIAVSAFAANTIIENQRFADETDNFLSAETIESKVNENFSQTNSAEPAENFACIMDCSESARIGNVSAYVKFICENNFTAEQILIINRILGKGTTVQTLRQVHDFWLSTDEDFSMIEDICSLEDEYFGEFWYEDAFNKLTDNKHGVLTSEDIAEYKAKDITLEQILAANTLSRKNGQNIFCILDALAAGETIEQQAKEIYGISVEFDDGSELETVNDIVKAKKYSVPSVMLASRKTNLNSLIDQTENAYESIVSAKISSELNRLGISENDGENEDYLKNCDYPVSVKKALLNKGYTPKEIYRASQIKTDDINDAAKQAREALKYEE